MAMGMFAFLSCARENPCIDAFCWDVQTAGMAQEESDIKGETDLDGFLAEIERFPWYDRPFWPSGTRRVANGFRHRFENRPLRVHFGGVGRQPEGQLLGRLHLSRAETFSWNRPPLPPCGDVRNGTNGSDYSVVKAFFGRDDQELRRRLAPLSPYLRVKESGGWSAYMDKKQQIVKQIK